MPHKTAGVVPGATPRRKRHAWTHEQRLCVWYIFQEFKLPRPERARVFNSIYQRDLESTGFPEGLSTKTVEIQYQMHKEGRPDWRAIVQAPRSPAESQLRIEVKAKIADVLAVTDDGSTGPTVPQQSSDLPRTPPSSRARSVASGSNKRPAYSMRTPAAQSESDDEESVVERPRKVIRAARVVIPPTPKSARRGSAAPAQSTLSRFQYRPTDVDQAVGSNVALDTPTRTPARKQGQPRVGATEQLHRPGRPTLFLKPHEYAETLPDLVDVEEELGKPHLPPLLFRYFDENSHGINTPDLPEGFICGRFRDAYVPVRAAPACNELEWNDLCWHLDHASHPSPFISTSNLFVWVVSKALKLAKKGARMGRISVIDTRQLSRSNVYWVPPFHESLSKKKPFKTGGFNYKGSHEHLVWHQVPGNAVLKTFSLADIFSLQAEDTAVSNMLRLAAVGVGRRNGISCEVLLTRDEMPLKSNITTVAKLVEFLGLNERSDARHLTYAVYQAIRGWELDVEKCNEQEWLNQAGVFAHYFCRKSEAPVNFSDLSKLKAAWLSGTRWSMSKTSNVRYNPDLIDKMLRGAEKVNLLDASSIVMNELGAAMGVVHLIEEGDTRDVELARGLQPLKALQTTARRQALLDYEASTPARDRATPFQNEPFTPTPTHSRRRAGARDVRPQQSATPQWPVRPSRAQLLLADGLDEDDEDYAQPAPSRSRPSFRPTRYEDSVSLPKGTRSVGSQLDFTDAIDGHDEDDEDYAEPGPSRRISHVRSRDLGEEIAYDDDEEDDGY